MDMKILCVFVCVCLVGWAAAVNRPRWHQLSQHYSFEQYKQDFEKRYPSTKENLLRKGIFEENLRTILQHNSGVSTYKMGVNHMTDWTPAERKSMLGYHKGLAHYQVAERNRKYESGELKQIAHPGDRELPRSIDWREKFVVTAVKDQGQCGSCWSFCSAETIESHWAIATGQLNVLSEQHILSCTSNPQHCGGTGGCDGGTAELAYSSLLNTGIASEWKYPYLSWYGNNSVCRFSDRVGATARLAGYRTLPSNEYLPLLWAVATIGPISISVDASVWHLYETGVFDQCNTTNPDINHGVQLVGYGTTTDGFDYWLIRNSWTPTFGEDGYIRVLRDHPGVCGVDITPADGTACDGGPATMKVCGMCGVLFDASYPIVSTDN